MTKQPLTDVQVLEISRRIAEREEPKPTFIESLDCGWFGTAGGWWLRFFEDDSTVMPRLYTEPDICLRLLKGLPEGTVLKRVSEGFAIIVPRKDIMAEFDYEPMKLEDVTAIAYCRVNNINLEDVL